jgi:hypothetical protein
MAPSLLLLLLLWSVGPAPAGRVAAVLGALLMGSMALAFRTPGAARLPTLAIPGYAVTVQLAGWLRALRGDVPRFWAP